MSHKSKAKRIRHSHAIGSTDRLRKLFHENILTVGVIAFLIVWTLGCVLITKYCTKAKVIKAITAQYTTEYNSKMDNFVQQWEADHAVPEDELMKIRMEAEATSMAKAAYGVRNVARNIDDIRTYYWCMFCRANNKIYPSTIEAVLSQGASQWMGYSENNPVFEEYYQEALKQLDVFYNGQLLVSEDFVYCDWDEGRFILRDDYIVTKTTKYWWYGK